MWVGVMLLVWEFIYEQQLNNCFWKIRVVLKRTLKLFTAVVLKMTDRRHGSGSIVAAVCRRLTTEKAEAGLVAADVLAVMQCWLEKRRLVLVCQLVKRLQGGNLLVAPHHFQRSLKVLNVVLTFFACSRGN